MILKCEYDELLVCRFCTRPAAIGLSGKPAKRNCPNTPVNVKPAIGSGQATGDLLCVHRGNETRRALCPSCNGHVQVKVFACAVHGECTLVKAVAPTYVCRTCTDRVAPG